MDELRDSDEKLQMQWIHYPVEGNFVIISCFHLNYYNKTPMSCIYDDEHYKRLIS